MIKISHLLPLAQFCYLGEIESRMHYFNRQFCSPQAEQARADFKRKYREVARRF